MNIEALRVFCEVARQQSFSRAAAALQITQSAASQAIQHLEKEVGQQLIDRSHRPPQLTAAGQVFYTGCRDALERLDQTISQTRELSHEAVGSVVVASIYSVGLYQTDAVRRFLETYPKASIRIQFLRPNLVVSAVVQGEAHLGLLSYPKETRDLEVIPWKEEVMVLVCPPKHRLAHSKIVRLDDLSGEEFIAFDSDLTIRKRIDSILNQHQVEVRIAMEFDNIETVKQAVQVGAGISILPEATARAEVAAGSLVSIPIDSPELVRPLGIIHRRGRPISAAGRRFIDILLGDSLVPVAAASAPALRRKQA